MPCRALGRGASTNVGCAQEQQFPVTLIPEHQTGWLNVRHRSVGPCLDVHRFYSIHRHWHLRCTLFGFRACKDRRQSRKGEHRQHCANHTSGLGQRRVPRKSTPRLLPIPHQRSTIDLPRRHDKFAVHQHVLAQQTVGLNGDDELARLRENDGRWRTCNPLEGVHQGERKDVVRPALRTASGWSARSFPAGERSL